MSSPTALLTHIPHSHPLPNAAQCLVCARQRVVLALDASPPSGRKGNCSAVLVSVRLRRLVLFFSLFFKVYRSLWWVPGHLKVFHIQICNLHHLHHHHHRPDTSKVILL